jgi:ribosomal protein S12 methylthiotransferase
MKTIGLISLGCPKNLVDSEVMLGLLEKAGYRIVADPARADVLIVNTCAFIEDAKKEAIDAILEMSQYKTQGKCKKLIVTGCLPQRYKGELAKLLPEVDLFIGTGEYQNIVEYISSSARKSVIPAGVSGDPVRSGDSSSSAASPADRRFRGNDSKYIHSSSTPRKLATPKHAVYIKIAEGCFHACSFCIIPKLRGRFRSRPVDDIVAEAKALVAGGARELNLIAQDTASYGRDLFHGTNLVKLLQAVTAVPGDFWVRVMYACPTSITPELIDEIASNKKVCKYLDIPIQHVSDRILAAMGRKEKGRDIITLVERLRREVKGLTLRTTVIVGFPGEAKKDFTELLSFVEDGHFDHLGAFAYSNEDGTRAAKLKGQVRRKEKERRRALIMKAQAAASKRSNDKWIGKRARVLIESPPPLAGEGRGEGAIARTQGQAPEIDGITRVKCDKKLNAGKFIEVEITGADEYDLTAVIPEGVIGDPAKSGDDRLIC